MENRINRIRLQVSVISTAVSFVIYFLTLAPGVTFTDSGELAAVCSTLGIAHPTGYPLFTIIGYLWHLLPLSSSVIYELNIFAAFLAALSSAALANAMLSLLLIISRKDTANFKIKHTGGIKHLILIPLLTSLTYSFASTVWAQGTSLEVYPLHLLIMNLALWSLFSAFTKDNVSVKKLALTAFLLGLGVSNHGTTLLLLPAFIFLFLKPPGRKFLFGDEKRKIFLILLIPFILGLSFYLYLPLRSAMLPELNWGWVHRSFEKFMYHVQGRQYQIWMFSGFDVMSDNFMKFLKLIPYQLGFAGIIPLTAGFIAGWKLSKSIFWFLMIFTFAILIYSLNYSIHDIDSYFLQSFTGMIIFSGIGIYYFREKIPYLITAAFLIPAANLVINYSGNDRSDDYLVPEYTRIVMENLDSNAVVISSQWDFWCSAFWYYQRVENKRRDVTLIEYELLRRTWYPKQLSLWYPGEIMKCGRQVDYYMEILERFESEKPYEPREIQSRFVNMINCFIDSNFPERPVYMTIDVIQKEPDIGKNYRKIPRGFVMKLDKSTGNPNITTDNIDIEKFRKSVLQNTGHLVEGIAQSAALNLAAAGNYALRYNDFKQAEKAFQKALSLDSSNQLALRGMQTLLTIKK